MLWVLLAALAMLAGGSAMRMAAADRRRRQLGHAGADAAPAGRALPESRQHDDHLLNASPERGAADARINDVVQHDGRDYLCEGVVLFDEDGRRWRSARVVDGADELWLQAGFDNSGGHGRLLRRDPSIDTGGFPSDSLVVGAEIYKLERRGVATCHLTGDLAGLANVLGKPTGHAERCRYWSYTLGDACAWVEQWGADTRVLVGRRLREGDIELLPGS